MLLPVGNVTLVKICKSSDKLNDQTSQLRYCEFPALRVCSQTLLAILHKVGDANSVLLNYLVHRRNAIKQPS
jgi:hypothetical protein